MSEYSDKHDQQEHLERTYRKYAPQYNAAFAADPNAQTRTFDPMAPVGDIQWKRLEAYRGNDKTAYQAHRSNPSDPLAKPTAQEAAAWKANQADMWRVEREPAFDKHEATNNKWLSMTPQARNSEQGQNFLAHVDQKHGVGYQAYAAKAGSNAVDRSDYLRTMAVLEVEGMRSQAQQQQRAPQAPAQTQANPAAFQQATPAQASAQQAPQQATAQQAPAENAPKTRLSLANFQGPTSEYVEQRGAEIAKASGSERTQIKQQAEAKVGDVQAQVKDAEGYTRLQNNLAALREERSRETLSQGQSRSRGQSR